MISKEVIDQIWEQSPKAEGKDENAFRLDPCGALIQRDKLNDRTDDYGWEIDHVFPKALLLEKHVPEDLIDDIINLRPMHWKNNDSKGFDYPEYHSCVTYEKSADNKDGSNIETDDFYEVYEDLQEKIKNMYSKYFDHDLKFQFFD